MPPKLSIIMPVVDVPHGSGRPHFEFRNSVESCLSQSGDFELLIGADGPQPACKSIVDSFNDPRARYFEYDYTGTWGNHQRNLLIKEVTGTHVTYLDHDDSYVQGGIELALETADLFPDRPIMYRMLTFHGHTKWAGTGHYESCPVTWDMIPPEDSLKPNEQPHQITSYIDCSMGVFPREGIVTEWTPEDNYNADWIFFIRTLNWFKKHKKDMLFVPIITKHMRPLARKMIEDSLDSMTEEEYAEFNW